VMVALAVPVVRYRQGLADTELRTGASTTRSQPPPTLPDGAPAWLIHAEGSVGIFATDGSGLIRDLGVPSIPPNDPGINPAVPYPPGHPLTGHHREGIPPGANTDLSPAYPQLGPDGRVYFRYGGGSCDDEVARVPVTGGDVETAYRPGLEAGVTGFAVSPDSRSLLVARVNHRCWESGISSVDLVLHDQQTGAERTIYSSDVGLLDTRLSFSSDGARIAFDTKEAVLGTLYHEVHVLELGATANTPRAITAPGGCDYRQPQFVSGTDQLVVTQQCGTGGSGSTIALVDSTTGQRLRTVLQPPDGMHIAGPATVDATGRHLLILMERADHEHAYRLPLAGGIPIPLYPEPHPGPAPFPATQLTW
jgi:hypothetical protein